MQVTTNRPADPRGWAGAAAARFDLRDYDGALTAYHACESACRSLEAGEAGKAVANLAHNIARVLEAQGRLTGAWHELDRITEPDSSSPHVSGAKGTVAGEDGQVDDGRWLSSESGNESARELSVEPDLSMICDLLDCYAHLDSPADEQWVVTEGLRLYSSDPRMLMKTAEFYWRHSDARSCMAHLRKALDKQGSSVACRGMLASNSR